MGIIDTSFDNSNHQLANLWEFYISKKQGEEWPLVARVISTSLPFINLAFETRNTGEKAYTGFTPIESFSITFYENRDFSTYQYFKDWMNSVFDENQGTFISMESGVEKGSEQDLINRTGFLTFESFKVEGQRAIEIFVKEITKGLNDITVTYGEGAVRQAAFQTITKKEYSFPGATTIVTKEILGNILTNLGRQAVQTAVGTVNSVANRARRIAGRPTKAAPRLPPPPTKKRYDIQRLPFEYNFDTETVERITQNIQQSLFRESRPEWVTYPTKTFKYENLKLLGLSELSLDYSNTEALQYSVTFTADRIIPLEQS